MVAALLGIVVSKTSVMLSHSLQFALLLCVLSNLVHHLIVKAAGAKGELSHWQRYGATYIVVVASVMILVHPTLFVFKDVGCPVRCLLRDHPILLSVVTHVGYLVLVVGIALSTDLVGKMRKQLGWHQSS
mmetsp:Transcript_53209/g.116799  ORF Transcript_53209/g.116799 Transcript_53209/m.116799 type:complete len:130 (-) Transcript_53209:299-688(-)